MSKSTRWFEIIQILRAAKRTVLARDLAEQLEVSVRTIYRDIAALQSMNTPIEGEAGVGYMMRIGYDLPALDFNLDELEALSVGLSLVTRIDDKALKQSAASAARKLDAVAPASHRLIASSWTATPEPIVDVTLIRVSIRNERKLKIDYRSEVGQRTVRVIQPLALIFYFDATLLAAWCELRKGIRHFRIDRMQVCEGLDEYFEGEGQALREQWEQLHRGEVVSSERWFQ